MKTYFGMSLGLVIVIAVLVMMIDSAVQSGISGGTSGDMSEAAVAERVAHVGQVNTGAPMAAEAPAAAPAVAAAPRSGEAVYKSTCFACHGTGAAGAPKLGDIAAWGPRIASGMDVLMNSALNGKNAMPPRGTCGTCSDDELKSAIEYMVAQSQ